MYNIENVETFGLLGNGLYNVGNVETFGLIGKNVRW